MPWENATQAALGAFLLIWDDSESSKPSAQLSMSAIIGGGVGLCVLAGFFYLGWWFLSQSLYRNLDEKDPAVQVGPGYAARASSDAGTCHAVDSPTSLLLCPYADAMVTRVHLLVQYAAPHPL